MSNTNNHIRQKVRIIISRIPWKKILTFMFFVLLSSIFWTMRVYRQKYESTMSLPIKYTNIPENIAFEQSLPNLITIRIRDDGSNIFKYYLQKRNDSILINISEFINDPQINIIQGRVLESIIRENLFSSSELLSYSPSQINYTHDVLSQKKIPVIYNGHINLSAGCMLARDLELCPDSVIVYGKIATLDTIKYAYTISDTIKDVHESMTVTAYMQYTQGVYYNPSQVEMLIHVDKRVEKEIEVPITCINLPKNMNIKFLPSKVKIPLSVGQKRFEDVNAEDFTATIDYNNILDLKGKTASISVSISKSPDFVKTYSPIPAEVEFVLEIK